MSHATLVDVIGHTKKRALCLLRTPERMKNWNGPERAGARRSLEGSDPSHQAAQTGGATLGHHLWASQIIDASTGS